MNGAPHSRSIFFFPRCLFASWPTLLSRSWLVSSSPVVVFTKLSQFPSPGKSDTSQAHKSLLTPPPTCATKSQRVMVKLGTVETAKNATTNLFGLCWIPWQWNANELTNLQLLLFYILPDGWNACTFLDGLASLAVKLSVSQSVRHTFPDPQLNS